MILVGLFIILGTLFAYLVNNARKVNSYWKEKGIKSLKPYLFVGNSLPVFLLKKHIADVYKDACEAYPAEPVLGFYDYLSPRLVVQDPDLIEKILIKDFQHFVDHGFPIPDEKTDPINHYQLFTLTGAKWRNMRYKMAPLFTTGKLKEFYGPLSQCGDKIIEFINKNPKNNVNLQEVIHLMVTEFVGMSIFGFDARVIENPQSEFVEMGKNIFTTNFIRSFLLLSAPKLGQLLGVSFNNEKKQNYFTNVIQDVFSQRQKTGTVRNDFVQMTLSLKEKVKNVVENLDPEDSYLKEDNQIKTTSLELTDEMLMSQAYTFMVTGLDTVPATIVFSFYDLANHQDIQDRVRQEILKQMEVHSGLTYDALKNMKYLENVVKESGRLHPLVRVIVRECTKDYTFPNGYEMKAGEMLHIPLLPVHLNPNNHSDPLKFNPDRFDSPVKPGTYFPFGDGPRVCIAMRFALLEIKYTIAKILLNYTVKLSPKTKLPLKVKPVPVLVELENPLYFDLVPIAGKI